MFVHPAGVGQIKEVGRKCILSVGVGHQGEDLSPDPALWLVDVNCLSLGAFGFA